MSYDSVSLAMLPLSSMGLDSTKDSFNILMDLIIKPGPGIYHEVRTRDKFVIKTKDVVRTSAPPQQGAS